MKENKQELHREWYLSEKPLYERLADSVRSTLVSAINQERISFLDVTARAKEVQSFEEKILRKKYKNPQTEMTDMAGIRVIAYIESDVERICKLIPTVFRVDWDRSPNKSGQLEQDRFGYRSIHFVCDLGDDRLRLLENASYNNKFFEIQVRTVLQHAWAEIEHDRGYKFGGTLPAEIQRRLYTASATLELVDREFVGIAEGLDRYAETVKKKLEDGDLDIDINNISLRVYMSDIARRFKKIPISNINDNNAKSVKLRILNLKKNDINKLSDLDVFMTEDFIKDYESFYKYGSDLSLIVYSLLYGNFEKYIEGNPLNLIFVSPGSIRFLSKKYPSETIEKLLAKNNIPLQSPSEPDSDSS